MKYPEDRHPLLYVYLDDDNELPERVRSRCMAQGASKIMGKWPEHVAFSWLMAIFGLLLTFFILTVVFLLLSFPSHHRGNKYFMEKCERNEHVVQLVHMKNLEDITINENATYFVEVVSEGVDIKDRACSVESYLNHTSTPVFLVTIYPTTSSEDLTIWKELEDKFPNFKTIVYDSDSFFNKTVFVNFQTQNSKFLEFLAKVLVSWNVGGTVVDPRMKTLRDYRNVFDADDKIVIGKHDQDVVFISVKRFCHVYVFDLLKTITDTQDLTSYSQVDIIDKAQKRFCHGRWNCTAVHQVSAPVVCAPSDFYDQCTFLVADENEEFSTPENVSLEKLCPNAINLTRNSRHFA